MQYVLMGFNVASMLLAALAAWLWYRSAVVKVPIEDGNKTGPEINVSGYALIATVEQQSTWNRRAAMAAGGAALCQAVSIAASFTGT